MAHEPRGMHPEDIKSQLRKRYGTLQGIALQMGLSRNAISNTISRPGISVPVEEAIAKMLGKTPYEVWPDRYHADGTPVSRVVARTPTRPIPADLRRNGAAA